MRYIIIQPDNRYAIWSTTVRDFLAIDMTEEQCVTKLADFAARAARSEEENRARSEMRQIGRGQNALLWQDCIKQKNRFREAQRENKVEFVR